MNIPCMKIDYCWNWLIINENICVNNLIRLVTGYKIDWEYSK